MDRCLPFTWNGSWNVASVHLVVLAVRVQAVSSAIAAAVAQVAGRAG